jgi:hypothetical protein
VGVYSTLKSLDVTPEYFRLVGIVGCLSIFLQCPEGMEQLLSSFSFGIRSAHPQRGIEVADA